MEQTSHGVDSGTRRDIDALLRDARRFARRHPALVIGGSIAAGIAVARFLRKSRRPSPSWHQADPRVPQDYTARDAVTDVDPAASRDAMARR